MKLSTVLTEVMASLGDRVDAELLPALYRASRLRTDQIRAELTQSGLAWWDPGDPSIPLERLDASADAVIRRARRVATLRGGLAGAAGALALPPELGVTFVQTLHLAQRLAVIFGHDPETERGRLLLFRAMAQAFELRLPRQLPAQPRVRELPMILRPSPGERATEHLRRTVALRALVTVGARVGRIIPGLGAGIGAADGHRSSKRQADRMCAALRASWPGHGLSLGPIEDAVEVSRSTLATPAAAR